MNPLKKKQTSHIKNILDAFHHTSGSEEENIVFKLATQWKHVVGKEMLFISSPLTYKNGILTLGIQDPTLIFHCQNISAEWIEKLNTFLGAKIIQKVEFKLI